MDIKTSLFSQPSNLQQPQPPTNQSHTNKSKRKSTEKQGKQQQQNMIESFDTSSNNDSFLQIEKQIQEEKTQKSVSQANQSELKLSDTSVLEFDPCNTKKLSLENKKEYPLSSTSKTSQDYKLGFALRGAIQKFTHDAQAKVPYSIENTEAKKKVRGNITTEKSSPMKLNEFIYIENDSDSQSKYQDLRQQHQKLLYRKSDSMQLTNFNPSHYSVHSQSSNLHQVRFDPNFGQSILETLNNIDNSKNHYNKSELTSQRDDFDFNQYTKSSRVSINQDISASDFRTRRNFSTNRSKVRLSQNFLKEGRVEEALIHVNEYISEQNQQEFDQAQAFYVRGQIFERMGYFPQAIQNYKTALQMNPQLINAALAKASCESRNGQLEDAIDSYAQALALEKEGAFINQNNNCIELRNENLKLDTSKNSLGKRQTMELPATSRNTRKEQEPTISKFGKIEISLDVVKKSATVTGVHSRKSSNVSDLNLRNEKKVNFKIEEEQKDKQKSKVLKGKKLKKPKVESTKQVTTLTNQKVVTGKKKISDQSNKSPLIAANKQKIQSPKIKRKDNSDLVVQTVPSNQIFPDFQKRASETFVYKKRPLEQQTIQVKGRNEKMQVVATEQALSKNSINLQSMKTIQTVSLQDSPLIKKKKSRGRQDAALSRSDASSRQSSNFNSKVTGQRSLYKRVDRSNSNSLLRKGKPVISNTNKKVQKVSSMNFKGQLIKIEQLMKDEQFCKAQETVDQLQEVVYNCKETLSKQNLEQYFKFQVMLKIKKGFTQEALVIINKYLEDSGDKKLLTAKCLIKMDNYKMALDEIQRMLIEQETFGLYYLKGKVLMLNKDWKSALISFNNASILDEDATQQKVNVMRAICYLRMKQENRFNLEIEEIKDRIKDLKPQHLLKLLKSIKESSGAFECCQFYLYSLILNRIPIKEGDQGSLKEVKLIEFIAKVYLEQNNYAKAISVLKGLTKKLEKHFSMIAKCYYKQQNFTETLSSLNHIKQQSLRISYFKLKVLYHCEKYKDAVAQVQFVISRNKKEEEGEEKLSLKQEGKALLYWGLCLSASKKHSLAVTQFTKIIEGDKFQGQEHDKIRTDAYHQRAKALQQTEQHEQAVEDLTYLINNKEESKYLSQWLLLRAISLQNLGYEQKAEKDYNSAKQI